MCGPRVSTVKNVFVYALVAFSLYSSLVRDRYALPRVQSVCELLCLSMCVLGRNAKVTWLLEYSVYTQKSLSVCVCVVP